MPKINIDELVEPIEIIVGGKDYTVDDISRDIMAKMTKLAHKTQLAEKAAKLAIEAGKEPKEDKNIEVMATMMAEVLDAKPEDIAALGMRKLNALVMSLMNTLKIELEAKNVLKVEATKSPK